jgi:hypothetical protein
MKVLFWGEWIANFIPMKHLNLFGKSLIAIAVSSLSVSLHAQIVGSDAFGQGNYVEVGVSQCGVYGSPVAPPAGYHPNAGFAPGLGFVADPDRDGWSVGPAPFNYCGDYFVPGSPVEGWALTFDGIDYINTNTGCTTFAIPGSITSYTSGVDEDTITWTGAVAGMTVIQRTLVPTDSVYFLTRMKLINTTGSPMTGVYYGRNVDPDNEQPWTGDFTTINKIVSQPVPGVTSDALVLSQGMAGHCFLGLGTQDDRASVNYGGFGTIPADDLYFGVGRTSTIGAVNTGDEGNGLGFSLGTIAPGDSVEFSFVYVMDTLDLAAAMLRCAPPCEATTSDITVNTCGSYFFNGSTLTTSGSYTATFMSLCGADSTVNLTLTLAPIDAAVSAAGATLTAQPGYTYQWVDCDAGYSPIAGATSQSFTALVNGHYACVLSTGACNDTTACTEVLVTSTTPSQEHIVTISPNPAVDKLTLDFGGNGATVEIQVLSITGQLVMEKTLLNTTTFTLDISGLEPGVYFVKARTNQGEQMVKVIKRD